MNIIDLRRILKSYVATVQLLYIEDNSRYCCGDYESAFFCLKSSLCPDWSSSLKLGRCPDWCATISVTTNNNKHTTTTTGHFLWLIGRARHSLVAVLCPTPMVGHPTCPTKPDLLYFSPFLPERSSNNLLKAFLTLQPDTAPLFLSKTQSNKLSQQASTILYWLYNLNF